MSIFNYLKKKYFIYGREYEFDVTFILHETSCSKFMVRKTIKSLGLKPSKLLFDDFAIVCELLIEDN